MGCLHSVPDVLSIPLPHMTYDLSVEVDDRPYIWSIRSLLSSTVVHLKRSVDTVQNIKVKSLAIFIENSHFTVRTESIVTHVSENIKQIQTTDVDGLIMPDDCHCTYTTIKSTRRYCSINLSKGYILLKIYHFN